MSDVIAEHHQALDAGTRVTLFVMDASEIGGEVLRFTPGPWDGSPVVFDGDTYAPIPIEADGFEWSGKGDLPTPKLSISNVGSAFVTMLIGTTDLLGAVVTRIRTFRQFLDAGDDPDPTAILAETYRVERKAELTRNSLVLELASQLDHEGVMLPRRVALKRTCTHRYRVWDGTAFDYTNATCPYVGAASFDRLGNATNDPNDNCGKRLSDCRLRFGQNARLPFRGFPAMGQIR